MTEKLYTSQQAAEAVGLSRERIRQRVNSGDIQVVYPQDLIGGAGIHNAYLIPQSEVDRLIAESEGGERPRGGRPARGSKTLAEQSQRKFLRRPPGATTSSRKRAGSPRGAEA